MEIAGIEIDATFIALVAFVLFFAVVIYLKVPGMVLKALDDRSQTIAKDLHDARKLREEAEKLLADYKAKQAAAEVEAKSIVEHAKEQAAAVAEETRAAMAEGLSGFTHLFNAMRPLASREGGPIAAALESPDVWFGMIVEGVHVGAEVLRLAVRGLALVLDRPIVAVTSFEAYLHALIDMIGWSSVVMGDVVTGERSSNRDDGGASRTGRAQRRVDMPEPPRQQVRHEPAERR